MDCLIQSSDHHSVTSTANDNIESTNETPTISLNNNNNNNSNQQQKKDSKVLASSSSPASSHKQQQQLLSTATISKSFNNNNSNKFFNMMMGNNYAKVELATRTLLLSHQQLEHICELLKNEFTRGLHRETNPVANVKMYPTHIRDQPTHYKTLGHFAEPEEGVFLALDLGGTNFRVILVELEGSNFHMDNETYSLSQDLMHGPGVQLFDYIADCLHKFVTKRNLNGHRLPLGFTFSFPCQQESIAHARLVNWTKGFKCSGVEGRDVVELLREAIERRPDLHIEVMAVVNDTTGTLIACAYQNRECRVGLIVGTGTNACYMERVDNVHCMHPLEDSTSKLNQQQEPASPYDDIWRCQKQQQTVVNTEWGAFGDNGILDFIRTCWDHDIDVNSVNPSRQKFEKMISGLYIGELCRRVMADMALEERCLFNHSAPIGDSTTTTTINTSSSSPSSSGDLYNQLCFADAERHRHRDKILIEGKFNRPFSFETKFVSQVESDPVDVFDNTRLALKEAFDIDWASDQDCASVKLICARASTRAAHLVSAAVACLLNKMGRPHTVVGVDGSMFKYHPHFHSIMAKKTKELTKPEFNFQLMFSEDGSGRGAAIVAAVASKQRRISKELLHESQLKASVVQQS